MPMTAMRGPSVGCSNSVSVVSMRSPKASHSSGSRGREPVAMMMLRVAWAFPPISTSPGPSSVARPDFCALPRFWVAFKAPATSSSRSARTRCSTAGRSATSAVAPRRPSSFQTWRRWSVLAASMSILEGMQPTRAHVVPQGPSFTMR